jgi:flagellar motor switch protein FliG
MSSELTGTRKSAIVLLALGPEAADQILRKLPNDCVKQVTREIATAARGVPADERGAALSDFVTAAGPAVKPAHVADARPPATAESRPRNPFADLHGAENAELLNSIRDEHPQTIALVLAHLPPNKASDVLAGLPQAKQVEVVKRIASIEQISSAVIDQVEQGLRQRLGHIMGRTIRSGGVSAVAEILNSADRRVEGEILDALQSDVPHLAEQIRRVQAIFEDLLHARDEDVRAVFDQLDVETIGLALRTARERLKRKVLRTLSTDEARQIEQEIHSVAPVRISEIEQAQQRVAEVVNRLERGGEIRVTGAAAPARRRRQQTPAAQQPQSLRANGLEEGA